jgi:hypothetical protein
VNPVAEVACGGGAHRIELVRGDVVLLDHDEPGARVLEALGGAAEGCVWLAATWRTPPWHDAVPCLLLDDAGAAAMAAGKTAAAEGLGKRPGRAVAAGVARLTTSAALVGLPGPFRRACGRRALAAAVTSWPLSAGDRELLERQLDPLVAQRLHAEGRHLPPGGRPVRVAILGPGARPALVPGRRAWEAHVPIDAVAWLIETADALSPWFEGPP